MSKFHSEDQGFQEDEPLKNAQQYNHRLNQYHQKYAKKHIEEPLQVISKSYSLEPDMMFGWTPKMPSMPMPLDYGNSLDEIKFLVKNDQRYKIAYLQENDSYNTVKLHQRYDYKWKDRSKYQFKIGFIEEAVTKIGKRENYENCAIENCQIKFCSKFQSGNLAFAVRVRANQYDLYLRNDSNTKGHTNWFHFQVSNEENLGPVQFNICNLKKTKNLYSKGMQPFILQNQNSQWRQGLCSEVNFVQRYCRYRQQTKVNQLQFKYRFYKKSMKVRCAYCIPYTYSKLQMFISQLSSQHLSIQNIGYSFASLQIPLLKITDQQVSSQSKKAFIIVGRTHPGESNSSYVLQGLVHELISNTEEASYLKKNYIFYIVPMLNVDGTVLGNFRCGARGYDLNRQFFKGNEEIQQVKSLQKLVQNIREKGQKIQFFCDFHGHSSKTNIFAYGPEHDKKNAYYMKSFVFLKLMAQKVNYFKFSQCTFSIPDYKKNTARSYMLKQQNIPMSFTFQISNGIINSQKQVLFYNQYKFMQAGKSFIKGIFQYRKGEQHLTNLLKAKKQLLYLKNGNLIKRCSLNIGKQSIPSNLQKLKRRNSRNHMLVFSKTQLQKQDIRELKIKKIIKQMDQKITKDQAQQQIYSDMQQDDEDFTKKQKEMLKKEIQCWRSKFMNPKMKETKNNALKQQVQLKMVFNTKDTKKGQQNQQFNYSLKKQDLVKASHKILGNEIKRISRKTYSHLILAPSKKNNSQFIKLKQSFQNKSKRRTIDLGALDKSQIMQNNSNSQSQVVLKSNLKQKRHTQVIVEQLEMQKGKEQFKMPFRLQKKNLQSATILLRSKRFLLANTMGSFFKESHS